MILFALLIGKRHLTGQYFESPWLPFTNTILTRPFRVTLPQRTCAADTFWAADQLQKGGKKVSLIGADRLAKRCSNYYLISGQQAESSIPLNINNLTPYKNPLRRDFKASNRCFGGGAVLLSFCLLSEVTQCQLKKGLKMMKGLGQR